MGKQHQILKQPIEEQMGSFMTEAESVMGKFRNVVQHVRNELIDMDVKWTKSSDLEETFKRTRWHLRRPCYHVEGYPQTPTRA